MLLLLCRRKSFFFSKKIDENLRWSTDPLPFFQLFKLCFLIFDNDCNWSASLKVLKNLFFGKTLCWQNSHLQTWAFSQKQCVFTVRTITLSGCLNFSFNADARNKRTRAVTYRKRWSRKPKSRMIYEHSLKCNDFRKTQRSKLVLVKLREWQRPNKKWTKIT